MPSLCMHTHTHTYIYIIYVFPAEDVVHPSPLIDINGAVEKDIRFLDAVEAQALLSKMKLTSMPKIVERFDDGAKHLMKSLQNFAFSWYSIVQAHPTVLSRTQPSLIITFCT